MRLAYLILCHKDFEQVRLLIEKLDNESVDFYIHVDKKVKVYPKVAKPNVYYLSEEERVTVNWASYEMVRATLLLISKCIGSGKTYDYVVLLSGQDFPIKANAEIQRFFEKGSAWNYIDVLDETNSYLKRFEKRVCLYYPKWMTKRNVFSKGIKKLYVLITGGDRHTFKLFKRHGMTKVRPFFGSQWWALQWKCLCWMAEYIEKDPAFATFFSNSLIPDESFFQTLFMKSPFSETSRGRIVYLEWNGSHPKTITKDLAKELVESECEYLFARKFDTTVDKEALEIVASRSN